MALTIYHNLPKKIEETFPALAEEARLKGQKENEEYWLRAIETSKEIIDASEKRQKAKSPQI